MLVNTITSTNCTPQTIVIGRRGTYDTLQIAFDLSYLIENYGSGTAVLAVKRSQDESAYPAVVTQEDNTLTWTVSETDTYYVGSGECQLMWYVDGGLAKTIIYPMVVMRDILSTAEEPPDGYENWIEHLTDLGAETQQNAQNAAQSASEAEQAKDDAVDAKEASEEAARKAAEASVHAPIIQNGYWYIWNDGQYVDTGVRAEGQKGDKGDTGEKGDTGNGIESITKTGTSGLVDTYTVTYTDGTTTTFTVTNGAKGDKGDTGATGNGIASIAKTGTSGNVDTYTITYTNGQTVTFTVTNGAVSSVAGKTGAVVLDSGDIEYDSTETYTSGTVGAELDDLTRQLSDVEENQIPELKNALSELDAGKEQIRIINDVYIATNGDEITYRSWSASDSIPINGVEFISITSPANNGGNYDAFYDANKTFVPSSAFNLKQGENIITVPDGAVYFRISNTTTAMEETVVKWWLAFEVENINNKISTIPFVSNNDQCNKFFKELYLEGADPSVTYKWYFAARNNPTYGYNAAIAIDGTTIIVAYLRSITSESTEPIIIPENNNSGVTGYAVLDWSALESGSNKTYNIPLNESVKDVTNSPVIYSYLHQGADSDVLIAMPDRIIAVVGDTLQLYYQGMFRCVSAYNYAVTLQCDVGAQYPRYYELTPTAANVGEHTLTVQLRDNNGNIISKKNVTINVVAAPTSPATQKNIFCVGASCTQNGEWAGEFKRKLTEDYNLTNINFIGRMAVNGTRLEATGGYSWLSYTNTNASLLYKFYFNSANLPSVVNVGDVYSSNGHNYTITEINIPTHDGGGYISCTSDGLPGGSSGTLTRVSGTGDNTLTYYNYTTRGNPFLYNGQINLPQYMTDYCGGVSPDVVYTELFVNGSSPYNNDVSPMMGNMKAFAQMFHAVYPNCKIALGMPYCPDEKGGTGENYNAAGGFSWQYGIKYTFMEYMKEIESYLSDNDLSGYVSLVDWTNEFDSENDFWQTTKAVNVRSTQTEVFGVNGIHPSTVGYMQMADSAVRHFIANFCQGT